MVVIKVASPYSSHMSMMGNFGSGGIYNNPIWRPASPAPIYSNAIWKKAAPHQMSDRWNGILYPSPGKTAEDRRREWVANQPSNSGMGIMDLSMKTNIFVNWLKSKGSYAQSAMQNPQSVYNEFISWVAKDPSRQQSYNDQLTSLIHSSRGY